MGINITQFSPPGTVSKLVWDDDMKPGAGKVFRGNLTGNVTGNVTGDMVGNITNGGVNGYLLRSGVVSASSGTLVVPAGSSTGNNPVTINLNGNGTYCIVGNTQKCFYPNPCLIPVVFGIQPWLSSNHNSYARSYDADGVLIDSVDNVSGNLNIYGASYIILNGGTGQEEGTYDCDMSVADAYIDADTTITPGMVPPPTSGVFTGDVVGNVTGNVTGNLTGNVTGNVVGNVTGKTAYSWTMTTDPDELAYTYMTLSPLGTTQIYQLPPGDTMKGAIRIRTSFSSVLYLRYIGASWNLTDSIPIEGDGVYTIPANTNGIYIRNSADTSVAINIYKFDMS